MKVIRAILLIVNILLAAALLLTTLAPIVPPSRSIIPSILAFGYLPLLAANVLMVVIWLLMKRWQCLVSIAVIALRWSFLPLFFQIGGTSKVPDRSDHPDMVTLMTYNVHLFQGREDNPELSAERALELLDLVRREQPNVLCMQEFALPRRIALCDSLMLMGYNHFYGAHTTKSGLPYGTVVFSQLPITYVNRIDSEKVMVEMVTPGGKRFRVCNIHADSFRFDSTDRHEMERMSRGEVDDASRGTIHKVKETILSHEEEWSKLLRPVVTESSMPLIVAGDMNDIPSSWLYHQLTQHLDDTYRDKGNGMSITYNGGSPRFRIDMVMHSKEWQTLSHKRIRSNMSDHYPIMTSMELKTEE